MHVAVSRLAIVRRSTYATQLQQLRIDRCHAAWQDCEAAAQCAMVVHTWHACSSVDHGRPLRSWSAARVVSKLLLRITLREHRVLAPR